VSHSVTASAYLTAGQYVELQGYSQYLGKILSNTTILTSLTLVSAGLTGPAGGIGYDPAVRVTDTKSNATGWSVTTLSNTAGLLVVDASGGNYSPDGLWGINGGVDGRRLLVYFKGQGSSNFMYFKHANTSETNASCRFDITADFYINGGETQEFRYDGIAARWMRIGAIA